MGSGVDQCYLGRSGESKGEGAISLKLDIVDCVLSDRGLARHGIVTGCEPFIQLEWGRVDLVVCIPPVLNTGVIQQVGDHPLGEQVFEAHIQSHIVQDDIHGIKAVIWMPHQSLGGLRSKAIQEVGCIQVTSPIAGKAVGSVVIDVIQLDIRSSGKGGRGIAAGVIAVEIGRQLGKALVEPRGFVPVPVPVDHVLEFVGQSAVIVLAVNVQVVHADVEHLHLVRVLPHCCDELIGAGVVTTDASQPSGV